MYLLRIKAAVGRRHFLTFGFCQKWIHFNRSPNHPSLKSREVFVLTVSCGCLRANLRQEWFFSDLIDLQKCSTFSTRNPISAGEAKNAATAISAEVTVVQDYNHTFKNNKSSICLPLKKIVQQRPPSRMFEGNLSVMAVGGEKKQKGPSAKCNLLAWGLESIQGCYRRKASRGGDKGKAGRPQGTRKRFMAQSKTKEPRSAKK